MTVSYPYIVPLPDGRRVVVVRETEEVVVAYALGPIDWMTTVLANPQIMDRAMEQCMPRVEKLIRQATERAKRRKGAKR